MLKKRFAAVTLIVFFILTCQPTPAHAGFFLFNIIHDILGGNHDSKAPSRPSQKNSTLIKFGMKSDQVTAVQKYLIKAKYLAGNADGVFGYKTLRAVKEFQRDVGLEADGIVGPRTASALKNFRGTKPQRKEPPRPSYRPPQNNSKIPNYLYAIPVKATAYTRYDDGCTDYTYRGTYLRRGLCAVDPDVIPFGTRLYVPGYGEALADDIGGAIRGNHIDLAMDTVDEAFEWGVRHITVYVLPNQ